MVLSYFLWKYLQPFLLNQCGFGMSYCALACFSKPSLVYFFLLIMSKSSSSLFNCEISPIRVINKHKTTPHRTRRNLFKKDECMDVPNTSTPIQSPGSINRSLSSQSSSFPYSQENSPDVVWDYTSPKRPRGAKKKEIKLTVKELIDNLDMCQPPENNTRQAQYIKLLENYMAKQNVPATVRKPVKTTKKRKHPHLLEEFQKFVETIPRELKKFVEPIPKKKKDSESHPRPIEDIGIVQDPTNVANNLKLNIPIENVLDGESNKCDSTEELWGDAEYSFIVKATQVLESVDPPQINNTSQELVSTIPETGPSSKIPVCKSTARHSTEKVDVETYDLLAQLTNVVWDSLNYDEWDNGFIEDDALSMIPDDVLNGNEVGGKITVPTQPNGPCNERTVPTDGNAESTVKLGTYSGDTGIYSLKDSNDDGFKIEELLRSELYNSFGDESFGDDSLLCQPDVLSRINEIESMVTHRPKCTPEEIEKKRVDAIKRRQKRP